jgi:hypothetical protein
MTSATGSPASTSRRIATICDSLNFDGRIVPPLGAPEVYLWLSSGRGSLRV